MGGDGGWTASAGAWIESVDTGDPSRELLLDPVVLALCGDVRGLRVLDVGCGEGRFARKLAASGAKVVGLDPIPALLARCRELDPVGGYLLASGEQMPVASDGFDLALAYLTLIDIPDFRAAIREMARALRPGGRLIAANLTGINTSNPEGWIKGAQGERLHFAVDRYLEERPNQVAWKGIQVVNWHRPLSAYMQTYLGAGLELEQYLEPQPSEHEVLENPGWEDYWRAPYFNVMAWRKPR